MTTYIFIWVLTYGNGMTSGSQEFGTLEACNKAALEFRDRVRDADRNIRTALMCTPRRTVK